MYLLTMDKLWKKRKAPVPLEWSEIQQLGEKPSIRLSVSVQLLIQGFNNIRFA